MRWLIVCLWCSLSLGAAFAQPDPDQPPAAPRWLQNVRTAGGGLLRDALANQHPQMLVTPQGLLVLKGGVLARLDPATLEQRQMLELFGPMPDIPLGAVTAEQRQQVVQVLIQRLQPAVMVPAQDDLLIVIGDAYFRVHGADLTVAAQSRLNQPFAQQADDPRNLLAVPTALIHEQTLYLTRGNQVLAINIADGNARAITNLPWQMQPLAEQANRIARQGKNNRQPAAVREVTLIGTLVKQQDNEGDHWLLRGEDGVEYPLDGNGLRKLAATPNIAGKRVRITGTLNLNDDEQDQPNTLNVTAYQPLSK